MTPQTPRPLPSNDPMWIASRFAWLYATIDGIGAVFVSLLALAGVMPWPAPLPLLILTIIMAVLARRIRAGDLGAAKGAAVIAILDGIVSLFVMVFVATRNPLLLIMSVLPIGIRITFAVQFMKPVRAASARRV